MNEKNEKSSFYLADRGNWGISVRQFSSGSLLVNNRLTSPRSRSFYPLWLFDRTVIYL
jgi:hypothetical protein